jgi:hypothetical protein
MRTLSKSIAIAACFSLFTLPAVDAFAGGGSNSSSSSSSSSKSSTSSSGSNGYSKPSSSPSSSSQGYTKPSTAPSSSPSSSSQGYTKPSTAPSSSPSSSSQEYTKPSTAPNSANNTPSTPKTPSTALGAASNKNLSADSLKAYQAERNSAAKPPQPINKTDTVNNPARSTYKNADQYMNKRTTVINNYHTNNPNVTSINRGMSPNYGMYDSNFLTGMVMGYLGTSMLQNSMWMYSHMNEPWYKSYRADLDTQAANNAELKAKIAAMDAEVAKLKEQNTQPHEKNIIPKEIDPALAIAPEAMILDDEHNNGISWWYAPLFFLVGVGATFFVFKLLK